MQVPADLTRRARLGSVGAGAEAWTSVGIRHKACILCMQGSSCWKLGTWRAGAMAAAATELL
jgi:hypothetical protein